MNTCTACGGQLSAGATKYPLCLVPVQPEEEEIYSLEASDEPIPAEWEGGAQVSFTSPFPRGGRAIVCSACQGIISADVSTL